MFQVPELSFCVFFSSINTKIWELTLSLLICQKLVPKIHGAVSEEVLRFFDAMEKMIPNGAPSLVGCKKLVVEGEIAFAKDVAPREPSWRADRNGCYKT